MAAAEAPRSLRHMIVTFAQRVVPIAGSRRFFLGLVGRVGIEPSTYGLKVQCSTDSATDPRIREGFRRGAHDTETTPAVHSKYRVGSGTAAALKPSRRSRQASQRPHARPCPSAW